MATFADSSVITTVSSSVTAFTDGAWVQLFNPASKNYKWMCVSLMVPPLGVGGGNGLCLFDIGIGESGSQVEIISDQLGSWWAAAGEPGNVNTIWSWPMTIDAETKVWIRLKDSAASIVIYQVAMTLSTIPLSVVVPTSSESFSTIGGISSPASAGDFGAFVTMFNSLAVDRTWLCLVLFTTEGTDLSAQFDIGSGDDPDSSVDFGELAFFKNHAGGSYHHCGAVYNIPVQWPAGTKLSLRVKDQSMNQEFYWAGATIF